MHDDLSDALDQHRQGRLDLAARAYASALAIDPGRPDALYLLGLVAFQRREFGRAAELMARAVAARPDVSDYHSGLAEAHRSLKRMDLALDCCREAVRLRPENPEALCNLGAILVDLGQVDEAVEYHRAALRLRPDFAAAHNNLGTALLIKGDMVGAIGHFREALRIDPSSGETHSNLAKILLGRGATQEARVHSLEAVRLRPELVAARIQLGNVLLVLGRLDESAASFREAIRRRPDDAAAHASLGGVLEQLGEIDPAMASYSDALKHDPTHPGALARLASRLKEKLPQAQVEAIEGLVTDPGLAEDRRLTLLFALGHVFDARTEYERATRLTARANALQLADLRTRGRAYDPGSFKVFVNELIAGFSPGFFERMRGLGLESDRPIFVVGLPRSGTSLVEQILASHPSVFGAGELMLARQAFDSLPIVTGRNGPLGECLENLGQDALRSLAGRYLAGLMSLNGSEERIVNKMPENYIYMGLLASMFPQAKFIHCRRDVRDVALSCWMSDFGQVRWACDLGHIATRIADSRRLMTHSHHAPTTFLEVDYEAVVADLELTSRAMVEWCGLDWDPACLDFHETKRPVRTVSVAQVRRPIYKTSVGRWRNYEPMLGPFFEGLIPSEMA